MRGIICNNSRYYYCRYGAIDFTSLLDLTVYTNWNALQCAYFHKMSLLSCFNCINCITLRMTYTWSRRRWN